MSEAPVRDCVTEREFHGVHLTPNPNTMGLAVSADLLPLRNPYVLIPPNVVPVLGRLDGDPSELQNVNTTTMEELFGG